MLLLLPRCGAACEPAPVSSRRLLREAAAVRIATR
jgi:hypothetical protein